MADLTVGKKAPLFTLPSDGGQDISLSDYKGGKVILYFYPKDNTSGCTLEAQAFRANLEEFKKPGVFCTWRKPRQREKALQFPRQV